MLSDEEAGEVALVLCAMAAIGLIFIVVLLWRLI